MGERSEQEASPESRYHRKCNDCDVASCASGTQPALRLGWATPLNVYYNVLAGETPAPQFLYLWSFIYFHPFGHKSLAWLRQMMFRARLVRGCNSQQPKFVKLFAH